MPRLAQVQRTAPDEHTLDLLAFQFNYFCNNVVARIEYKVIEYSVIGQNESSNCGI